MARKQTDSISAEQLRRMLARYVAVLEQRTKLDPSDAPPNLLRARMCADAALVAIATGSLADARHLTGFVQGILLCSGIHTWEYLATDDRRE